MSVITGIKGYSKSHWKQFMEDVEEDSLLVEYDNEYGNQSKYTFKLESRTPDPKGNGSYPVQGEIYSHSNKLQDYWIGTQEAVVESGVSK